MRCECLGRPEIKAGSTVEIDNAGTKLSGTYYVTSVEHHFGRGGDMTTTFTTGAADSASIVDLLGGGAERVGAFGQLGLTIGIVTNNKDPDGVGRVRVKFPALSDQEESWWARVVTPGGGSNAGLMFMPQIDDEVLVGFEHGDLRRPFVLGGAVGRRRPSRRRRRRRSSPRTRSSSGGCGRPNGTTLGVRSGDQPADKHFKVALPDGTTQYLGSDKIEIIAMNKSIELKSGQASILITDQGDIQLKGGNIKIEATQGVTIDGLTIAAKAKTSCKAEGRRSLELKGGATANAARRRASPRSRARWSRSTRRARDARVGRSRLHRAGHPVPAARRPVGLDRPRLAAPTTSTPASAWRSSRRPASG